LSTSLQWSNDGNGDGDDGDEDDGDGDDGVMMMVT